LRGVEPSTDTKPITIVAITSNDNFFDRMEAPTWLNLEEDELIPTWGNDF
jgi:hypothetical protein